MKLLLDKGAEAAPGAGVLFNASPMVLAAMAGESENIRLLRVKGADPGRKMTLLGTFPNSPLFIAAVFGNVAVTRAVVAAGADLRETDQDGMSALHWAALGNRLDVVKTLVAAGTPLNQRDKYGFTPLMYAATVDFGDAEMVQTLLQAGADPKAKTKEGTTALAQAKRFRYAHIQAALERSSARE